MKRQVVYRLGKSDTIWDYVEILGDRYMRSTCDEFAKTDVIPLIETNKNDHSIVLIDSLDGVGHYIFWGTTPTVLEESLKDEVRNLPPHMKLDYLEKLRSNAMEELEWTTDITLDQAKMKILSCFEHLSYFSCQVEDEGLF